MRPYQVDAVARISSAHREGHHGVLLVVATGGGKTIIFSHIAAALSAAGACVLIVVPGRELVSQTADKLRRLGVRVGVISASHGANMDPGALIQVATVQTLRSRPRAMLRQPNYIVFDEAHLSAAESYRMVRERYPDARRLGVTATPWRMDEAGFEDLASVIVPGPSMAELQADGFLVPFRVVSSPLTSFATSRRSRSEFNQRAVSEAYAKTQLVGDVVDHWCEAAGPSRSGLVFAASIEHSRKLCDEFLLRGVQAEHVDGETDKRDRLAILSRLDRGETQVVCNFGVLTAGFDCPRVEVLSVARATASKSLWMQMAGRAMRPCAEVGKTGAVILDHGGNRWRHGPLGGPHAYSLSGRSKADDVDDVPAEIGKECDRCHTWIDVVVSNCPHCGFDFVAAAARERENIPETIAGRLVEVGEHESAPVVVKAPHMLTLRKQALERADSVIDRLRRTG